MQQMEPLALRLQKAEEMLRVEAVNEENMRTKGRAIRSSQRVVEKLIQRLESV
jgi:hypothetical protein